MGGYNAGWGSSGASSGSTGGVVTISAPASLPLLEGNYDDFDLSYDSNDNLIQVKCYRDTVLLLTINLQYDINDNLIKVVEV